MREINSEVFACDTLKNLEKRPPVIGSEVALYVPEDVVEPYVQPVISPLMHALPDPAGKPPTLLPKPKIGLGGNATQRGPPPPVLPRSSSLTVNPSSSNVTEGLPKTPDEMKGDVKSLSSETNQDAPVISSSFNKLDAVQSEANSSSPSLPKSAGSENSRGFEPEGSVDMSPSYSESNASGGASTSNTTPPFIRWQEGFSSLIEDAEGCSLFKEYLTEENLGHYFDFLTLCRALKTFEQVGSITKLVKIIYKKYINPRGTLDCKISMIDDASRTLIEGKLSEPDRNIFDGAYEAVFNHISSQYYPNFLKSDIFVNFVREAETDSRLLSASSSVTGSHNQRDIQVDSGMEEDKTLSSSKSSTVPINSASDPAVFQNPEKCSTLSSVEHLRPLSGSSTTCASSLFNSSQFLPTLEEDRELRLEASSSGLKEKVWPGSHTLLGSLSQAGQGRRTMPREGGLSTWHPPPTNSTRLFPVGPDEVHPGWNATSQVPDPRKLSYAYHANSSNWITVSRQDSELQSLSSGAMGGDTTDDNYSTFTDVKMDARKSMSKKSREEKLKGRSASFDPHRVSGNLIKENPNQLLPRKIEPIQIPKPYPNGPNPSKDFEKFANVLISKLNVLTKKKESGEKVMQLMSQVNDGDSSVASGGQNESHKKRFQQLAVFSATSRSDQMDAESDQSILEDHVNRIFTGSDGPEFSRKNNVTANTSSMLDMSRRSNNTSMTLPGRSRHGGGYNQYLSHQVSSQPPAQQYRSQYSGTTASAGDLLASRVPMGSTSKSLIEMNVSGSQPQMQAYHHHSRAGSFQPSMPLDHKIHNWSGDQSVPVSGVGNVEYPGIKTSPRSSGRYHPSSRAKSQGRTGMYNLSQSFNAQYSSTLDPNNLAMRLTQQQEQTMQQHLNRSSNMRGVLTSGAQPGPSSLHGTVQRMATAVVYRFPQEHDATPYRVKINKQNLTLLDIKSAMPKNSTNFRFYFKTEVNGEAFFEQESNDAALVPMWEEGLVYVQCRND